MTTPKDSLNEREFELVNIVGAELAANQRDLSRHMNISLGMTNMLLRRLVTKGYIRIKQLDRRKVEYLLTPKGFAEKMRKSIRYTMKTIDSIGLIQQGIVRLVQDLYSQGIRKFYLLGSSDLTVLVEMSLRKEQWQDCSFLKVESPSLAQADGVLLICREEAQLRVPEGVQVVNVVEELAKDNLVTGNSMPIVAA
ncbi:MAG: MarR family transcriptional regulator [Candidatus Omnitrophica bacterium]|nr:MarR family transcriptional regulator [Candidatus Omnitrophota bacterium]